MWSDVSWCWCRPLSSVYLKACKQRNGSFSLEKQHYFGKEMATDYYNIFLLWEKPVVVFALLVFPLGVAVFYPLYRGRRREMYPPCLGWIPWLGCAVQFGKAPLDFIEESRRKVNV